MQSLKQNTSQSARPQATFLASAFLNVIKEYIQDPTPTEILLRLGWAVLRSEKSRFLGTSADEDSDLGLFGLFARSGNLLYAEEPGGPGEFDD